MALKQPSGESRNGGYCMSEFLRSPATSGSHLSPSLNDMIRVYLRACHIHNSCPQDIGAPHLTVSDPIMPKCNFTLPQSQNVQKKASL